MKFLRKFNEHASYEAELNVGGGLLDISLPNVSYCEDVKDVHYNPYNTVEFYVGEITGTTPQTVKIYTDKSTSIDVTVSEGNKWYTYLLPKDKGLYFINANLIRKVNIKANISYCYTCGAFTSIIPNLTVEASFKGSNTSNVTDMNSMFSGCSGLTSLDLSGWDTSKVTSMSSMFNGCNSLTSLDLSGWNTSNVTNMYSMFYYCDSLTSLDLSNFDTSKVTDMSGMFSGCNSLTSLDLSGWDTSKVTSMSQMFYGCTNLEFLDLSGWDTSNVTDMDSMIDMFNGCSKLKTIRMVGCNLDTIQKITNAKPSGATITTK